MDTYDIFVSAAEEDLDWVDHYLLPELNLPDARKITHADFDPGKPRIEEFERAVTESRFTLIVVSPAYFADRWAEHARNISTYLAVEDNNNRRIIPILLKTVKTPLTIAHLVPVDCTDTNRWPEEVKNLRRALGRPKPPMPKPIVCPYPGMRPFESQDSPFFFGRGTEIQYIIQFVVHSSFLLVVGPSGSGKSSLISAGVLPRLRNQSTTGGWRSKEFRPGSQPAAVTAQLHDLANEETSATTQMSAPRTLVFIDQFEEIFTQASATEQTEFIGAMGALRNRPNHVVIITMRADFFADLMQSELWPVNPEQRLEVTQLQSANLREAICKPAAAVDVYLEDALVERLLIEAEGQPGILPLLQETLRLLWQFKQQRYITLQSYERLGQDGRTGLQQAITTKANATMGELKSESRRLIAQRIFVRLVQFVEGRPPVRRPQTVAQLMSAGDNEDDFEFTLQHLVHNHLLTIRGSESNESRIVDMSHERLIDAWPTLQNWLGQWQDVEKTRRWLERKTDEWTAYDESGGLLDDVELRDAEKWLQEPLRLSVGAKQSVLDLIDTSKKVLHERDERERRQRQQVEDLLRAKVEAQQRRAEVAERLRLNATALAMAVQAQQGVGGPHLSRLLARQAYLFNRRSKGHAEAQTDSGLRQSLASDHLAPVLPGHESLVRALAFSRDGTWLASGDDNGNILLWPTTQLDTVSATQNGGKSHPVVLKQRPDSGVQSLAFHPNGRWLACLTHDGSVLLYDVQSDGEKFLQLGAQGHFASIVSLNWSYDKNAVYDHLTATISFAPDGRFAAATDNDMVEVWEIGENDRVALVCSAAGHRNVQFDPEGNFLTQWGGTGRVAA